MKIMNIGDVYLLKDRNDWYAVIYKIDESDISKPIINALVLDNIREVFEKNLGIDVKIQHVEPDLEFMNYNVEIKNYINK